MRTKKVIIVKCNHCKYITKGYNWECENGIMSLVVGWTCSKQKRSLLKTKIQASYVITTNFNKDEFEEELWGTVIFIPDWCPLEDQ